MKRWITLLGVLVVTSPLVFMPSPEAQGQAVGTGFASLTWVPPTACTDGSLAQVTETRVYREVDGSQIFSLRTTVSAPASSFLDDQLFNGDYCYAVTAVAQCGIAVGVVESEYSNIGCKTINIGGNRPVPLAPVLTVQ